DVDNLHEMFSHCIKNPGHKEFIPITRFSKASLPEGFRDIDLYELVKATSDLTVLVVADRISNKRPEYFANTFCKYPYCICEEAMKPCSIVRAASGEISIFKYADGRGTDDHGTTYDVVTGNKLQTEYKTCPCRHCLNSEKPQNVWWEIFILTAVHMVFNLDEASSTYCELFFNEDESSSREILKDLTICYRNVREDRCQLKYVTCDETQGNKLFHLGLRRNHIREKVLRKFKDSKFMFMVSHPHGCAKQVSMGELKENTKCGELNANIDLSKLSYLMATCPGCSGAAVHCIGFNHQHAHSGTDSDSNENFSGVGLLFK
ncbi:RNA polymerase II-associated protein 3, partial [Biomphalaria glabrata]